MFFPHLSSALSADFLPERRSGQSLAVVKVAAVRAVCPGVGDGHRSPDFRGGKNHTVPAFDDRIGKYVFPVPARKDKPAELSVFRLQTRTGVFKTDNDFFIFSFHGLDARTVRDQASFAVCDLSSLKRKAFCDILLVARVNVVPFPDVNRHEPPTVTADFTGQPLENILDDDNTSFIRLPISQPGSQASVTLAYDEPYSPQFIELTFGEIHLFVKGLIEASADGKTYREAARFDYKIRTDLRQPKCIRLNEAARDARFFRVTFYYRPYRAWMRPANVQLNRMRLLASSMVSDVDSRNSAMEDAFSYKPFEADYTTPGADPSQVIDLSDRLEADGTLDWDVPAGNWTILRIGHTPTGKTNGPTSFRGLECNKLDRRGLNAHWPEMMKKIEAQLAHTGVLKYAIIDSYEAGGQNWTEGFEQEFCAHESIARITEKVADFRKLGFVHLHDIGARKRKIENLFRVVFQAQVYVEHFQAVGRTSVEQTAERVARRIGTLGERAEIEYVRRGSVRARAFLVFDEVPSAVSGDFELRVVGVVEQNPHFARGLYIRRNELG